MAKQTLELLFAARIRRATAAESQRHQHADFWQVEYALSGPIHYEIDGHTSPLPDGAILAIPPGCSHHQLSPQGADSYLLKFRAPSLPVTVTGPALVQLTTPERDIADRLFAALVYEHDGRSARRDEMIAALVSQLIIWIGRWSKQPPLDRHPSSPSDARERVRVVGDMLRREYTRSLSVSDLAKAACLSRSRFIELFRKEFDASPVAFHTRVRMEKAVELARHTGMSWQQIAAQLGYDDPAYFSRAFKKALGASPTHFTAAHE